MKKLKHLLVLPALILAGSRGFSQDQAAHFAALTEAANKANQTAEPVAPDRSSPIGIR